MNIHTTSKLLLAATLVTAACGDEDGRGVGMTPSETDGNSPGIGATEPGDQDGRQGAGDGDEQNPGSDDATCRPTQYSFDLDPGESARTNVMLVLDQSNSMVNVWDHDMDADTPNIMRYESMRNVVESLLNEFDDRFQFGAQFFPAVGAWLDEPDNRFSCLVERNPEVEIGEDDAADAILDAMPEPMAFTRSGGTPLGAALDSAIEHLEDEAPDEKKAVILITDGAANCGEDEPADRTLFEYDQSVPERIKDAYDEGVPTYVVGIDIQDEMGTKPAVNPFEAVTDAAEAGGAQADGDNPFYNATNESELEEALANIASEIECTIDLDVVPEYPEDVSVAMDDDNLDQVTDCDDDGWKYPSNENAPKTIMLCGNACEDAQEGGTVTVEYGCPSDEG